MNIRRPIPLFVVAAAAAPAAFSTACNDDRQGLDSATDVDTDDGTGIEGYDCCGNEGWYPNGYEYGVDTDVVDHDTDIGFDTDAALDADTGLDPDADVEDEPYYTGNEGWYPNGYYDVYDADVYDADVYDADTGDADVTDAADVDAAVDAEPADGSGDSAEEASLAPRGLDWNALAWCAPDPQRTGLRHYRRIPSPFMPDGEAT